MIKVLLMCKNNSTAKSLINYVTANIQELHIIGIANTLEEGIKLQKKHKPVLIITTSESFVKYINENGRSYTPGIILISKKDDNNEIYYKFKNLLLHISSTENFKVISEQTIIFIDQHYTTSKRKKIREILESMGFNIKLSGTQFLIDTIIYINTFRGSLYFEQLTKDIYPHVAKINNTTVDIVKWSIIRTINYMYEKHDAKSFKNVEKYLSIKYPERPTPKSVITSLANILND